MTTEVFTNLKNDLVALIKNVVAPYTLSIDEITAFMNTGVIPISWWTQIFDKNISHNQMAKLTDLMDSIHVGVIQEDVSPADIQSEIVDDMSISVTKKHPSGEITSPHSTSEVTKEDLKSPSKNEMLRKKRGKNFSQSKKSSPLPKKAILSEVQMAKNLFSLFIGQALIDEKLDLTKLRALIEKNLSDHSIGHDHQKKELTLYDENTHPITTYDIGRFIVISV